MMQVLKAFILTIGMSLVASLGQAATIGWSLQDVVLADGATVTGGFSFEAATNSYSDILIERSIGSVQEAATFTSLTPAPSVTPTAGFAIFVTGAADLTDTLFLQLVFDAPLTDPGVATPISTFASGTGRCFNADCSKVYPTGAQLVTSGFVAPVPLPASGVLLLGAGLALDGMRRFRRVPG